jgi:hypothetical protein
MPLVQRGLTNSGVHQGGVRADEAAYRDRTATRREGTMYTRARRWTHHSGRVQRSDPIEGRRPVRLQQADVLNVDRPPVLPCTFGGRGGAWGGRRPPASGGRAASARSRPSLRSGASGRRSDHRGTPHAGPCREFTPGVGAVPGNHSGADSRCRSWRRTAAPGAGDSRSARATRGDTCALRLTGRGPPRGQGPGRGVLRRLPVRRQLGG